MFLTHCPEPGHQEEDEWIYNDGIGNGKEANGSRCEEETRDRDEGVRGVKVTTQQEPCNDRTEAAAGQSPLVNQVEITPAPAGSYKT